MIDLGAYGTGTIEPRGSKFRARVYVGGRLRTIGTYPTREEAESSLRGWAQLRASERVETSATTLRVWGDRWLNRRELAGSRDIKNDRNRWDNHVLSAHFADAPLESIGRRDVRQWIDMLRAKDADDNRTKRRLGWQTVKHCLTLLRAALNGAVDDELIERNPAAGIRIKKPASADQGWTYLLPAEQTRLLTCAEIPEAERLIAGFALATGLRQGEQWALELRDLHVEGSEPHVYVRWGKPGLPPKNGKPRRVPLTGLGLAVAKRWLELLQGYLKPFHRAYANTHALVFPTHRGCRRRSNKPPRGWRAHLAAAGIADLEKRHDRRAVRWHDLRHSCASSLVAGWWGRAWRLDETRDVLGHTSITVTERYAHLAPSVLASAAAATNFPTTSPSIAAIESQTPCSKGRATVDSNHWPSAPEAPVKLASALELQSIGESSGKVEALRELAARYLRAIASRNRFSHRYGIELAEALLEATEAAPKNRRRVG